MISRLVVAAALLVVGCGGADVVNSCAASTIESTCATTNGPCHDRHDNVCIVCAGSHVSDECIYDPLAPLDGGTAVCVKDCSECGSECAPS